MALKASPSLLRPLRWSPLVGRAPRSPSSPLDRLAHRVYSASTHDAPPPPLLQKLKADLKHAMRAKDAPRLSVLRAIMSASLNASKTSSPVRTDVQLVALMRRIQKSVQDAAADAENAGRDDLVRKEADQLRVLDEYLAGSGVRTVDEAELRSLVHEAVEASRGAGTATKSLVGDVMKRLAVALEGKDVDRKAVADMVRHAVGA
ncbi:uncharacterized protein UV8b_01528 [Ustilaginoidea virens]|uniref:Altered inheritance of mitochondria protein 41 n=1 Tax=Ustilaginoidea virens TaxID=1159556 RepID=A0A1B5KZZ7_USTVR|nr:uncharacterized protein UV8b_01528 [Ustilaginoidea virens]QUC17287.1 hypothetical protein UV8b_01528 [Ustilaginoidea virens]GAO15670.1 hypothetical protein UVI_02019150 [Ustilaginoidea virens]